MLHFVHSFTRFGMSSFRSCHSLTAYFIGKLWVISSGNRIFLPSLIGITLSSTDNVIFKIWSFVPFLFMGTLLGRISITFELGNHPNERKCSLPLFLTWIATIPSSEFIASSRYRSIRPHLCPVIVTVPSLIISLYSLVLVINKTARLQLLSTVGFCTATCVFADGILCDCVSCLCSCHWSYPSTFPINFYTLLFF